MSIYAVSDTQLNAIAQAINAKTGNTAKMSVSDMPNEIAQIVSGDGSPFEYIGEVTGRTSSSGTYGEIEVALPDDGEICMDVFVARNPGTNYCPYFCVVSNVKNISGANKAGYIVVGRYSVSYGNFTLNTISDNNTVVIQGASGRLFTGITYDAYRKR